MSVVAAGPFDAVSALVGLAGLAKLVRPQRAAEAVRTAGLPSSKLAVRALGFGEVALAVGAIGWGSRPLAIVVAALYVGFAGFVLRLIARSDGQADCGCFGAATPEPASQVHVSLNLAAAVVCGLAAAAPPGSLRSVLDGQPLAGVPFVLLTALCTWLAYASFTLLTSLRSAERDGSATVR